MAKRRYNPKQMLEVAMRACCLSLLLSSQLHEHGNGSVCSRVEPSSQILTSLQGQLDPTLRGQHSSRFSHGTLAELNTREACPQGARWWLLRLMRIVRHYTNSPNDTTYFASGFSGNRDEHYSRTFDAMAAKGNATTTRRREKTPYHRLISRS